MPPILEYSVLPATLAVCQQAANSSVPEWAWKAGFVSATRSGDELSVVCDEDAVPDGIRAEKNWVALKLHGPFPFSMTGVLASFLQPLAEGGVPIFAISTFDTDYVLVKNEDLARAKAALAGAGHWERV